ncbi:hypothetical protein GmHk_03G008194 [Glycine max]|nr:hypothetical protein GmHk_03G008194 [Glycine max]
MEEEGDIYDGAPAQFPISFGKQSKPQTPLEAIHTATRRSNSNPKTANDLPSISSSSRECLLVDHDFKFLSVLVLLCIWLFFSSSNLHFIFFLCFPLECCGEREREENINFKKKIVADVLVEEVDLHVEIQQNAPIMDLSKIRS